MSRLCSFVDQIARELKGSASQISRSGAENHWSSTAQLWAFRTRSPGPTEKGEAHTMVQPERTPRQQPGTEPDAARQRVLPPHIGVAKTHP
jgi:hypothetical protein